MISKEQIEQAIKGALDKLVQEDRYLFLVDANERALSHRMAIYLEEKIKEIEADWNVDCEYNRDVASEKEPYIKKLQLDDDPPPSDFDDAPYQDENATTVFPDIIVHKRGKTGFEEGNLLVIEVKKRTSSVGEGYDKEKKLPAYLEHLKYRYAYFVLLDTKGKCGYQFELIG